KQWTDWQAGPASSYEDGHYRWTEKELWGQDRSKMGTSFTGIGGLLAEDFAVSLSYGTSHGQTQEHLVPNDRVVVWLRRRLLHAAHELQRGVEPFHLKPEQAQVIGGVNTLLPETDKWREAMFPTTHHSRRHADDCFEAPTSSGAQSEVPRAVARISAMR